jgi:hypothetical protein
MALIERDIEPSVAAVWSRGSVQQDVVVGRLADRYGARVDLAVVTAVVRSSFAAYADAAVTLYVPILAERRADEHLRAIAAADA